MHINKKISWTRTFVINDPFGQTHSPGSSDHYFHFALRDLDGRTCVKILICTGCDYRGQPNGSKMHIFTTIYWNHLFSWHTWPLLPEIWLLSYLAYLTNEPDFHTKQIRFPILDAIGRLSRPDPSNQRILLSKTWCTGHLLDLHHKFYKDNIFHIIYLQLHYLKLWICVFYAFFAS